MEKLSIYIVEDDMIILKSFCMAVEKIGHRVVGRALDGIAAVSEIRELNPDIVLMDINIPGKNGLDVIREVCVERKIPTIVITGHISDELIAKANCDCVFGYLMKPVSTKELQAAISIAWSRHEAYCDVEKEAVNCKAELRIRKLVERAKGILMDGFDLKEDEAMKKLQKMSKDKRKPIEKVAADIIHVKENMGI